MTVVNYYGKSTELTELESKVVKDLTGRDEYDERPYAHIDELGAIIEPRQLRGVLSSLVQKDVITIEPDFFRKGGGTIIFLISK